MSARLKKRIGPLALVSVSVLATLVLGEAVARHVFPPIGREIVAERLTESALHEAHPVLRWRPRANATLHHKRFDVTYTTNSRGLRDREHSLDERAGVTRIVTLGDSFTWGYGVRREAAYPALLERRLAATEVINLGVTGFGLRQAFEFLKLEGALYRPDAVILGLCQNDIYEGRPRVDPPTEARMPRAPDRAGSFAAVKSWLSRELVLYRLMQQAINTHRQLLNVLVATGLKDALHGFDGLDYSLMPALIRYPPQLQGAWEEAEADLLRMRDWLAERGIRFVVALIPARQAIESRSFEHSIAYTVYESSDFDLGKPYRNLEWFAKSHSIEVMNAYPAFMRRYGADPRTLYLPQDSHFNEAGHEVFADEIVAHLRRGP
ncbi:MAG: hypothetical protein IT529_15350 [Burkholderiales bacterium]|nr:hypothetical protein [Burkholderiales bacterium]